VIIAAIALDPALCALDAVLAAGRHAQSSAESKNSGRSEASLVKSCMTW
jgi:hypothetical protein